MILLDQFLNTITTERRATRSTLSAYEADLRHFYGFLQGQNPEDVTSSDLQAYVKAQQQLSPATVMRRLSSLRQFYAYLVAQEAITENPFSLIKIAQVKPLPPSPLNHAYRERLWEGLKAWRGPEGKRLSALLHLLQGTELLVKDIVSLPVAFDVKRVTAPQSTQKALKDYLEVRDCFLVNRQESPWLFPSSSRKGHLTPQRFGQLLKELGTRLNLETTIISLPNFRKGSAVPPTHENEYGTLMTLMLKVF